MAKLVLTDLSNLQNEQTAVAAINGNSAAIEAALENTLSRDGTSPNGMLSALRNQSVKLSLTPFRVTSPISNHW
jgi:hypothetical protein